MTTLKKDKAGNRIVRDDFDGKLGVVNKKGDYVNPKDTKKYLESHGFSTKTNSGKLFAKPKRGTAW